MTDFKDLLTTFSVAQPDRLVLIVSAHVVPKALLWVPSCKIFVGAAQVLKKKEPL
jgi:hypothetical protein